MVVVQVPLHKRTFFSAAFVAAGTLGMATGPALAGSLENVNFDMGKKRISLYLLSLRYIHIYIYVYYYYCYLCAFLSKHENVFGYRSIWKR